MTKTSPSQQKMKKHIEIPIFNIEYKVVVCWYDWATERDELQEIFDLCKCPYKPPKPGSGRSWTAFSPSVPIICLQEFPKDAVGMAALAHEAAHAVSWIFEKMDEENTNHESFAHSIGAVVRVTLESEQKKETNEV